MRRFFMPFGVFLGAGLDGETPSAPIVVGARQRVGGWIGQICRMLTR